MMEFLWDRPYGAWRFGVILLAAGLAAAFPGQERIRRSWVRLLRLAWGLSAIWWLTLEGLRWGALAHDYDLAHLASALHQTLRGNFLGSTYLGGSILSHHLYMTHLLFLPFLEIFRSALVLQIGQVVSLLGASLLFGFYFGEKFRDPSFGWTISLAFLLHPAATGLAFSDYDPASLGLFFLALAVFWNERRRRRAALGALLLAYGAKEIFPLGGLLYGGLLVVRREKRRDGLWIAGTAFLVLAAWTLAKPPMHPPYDAEAYFAQRFEWFHPGAGVAWREIPGTVATAAKAGYLLHLLVPFALLAFLAPGPIAFALPEMGINILATFGMTGMALHYHFATLPALLLSSGEAAGARPRARGALLAAAVVAAVFSLNSPFAADFIYSMSLPDDPGVERARLQAVIASLPREGRIAVFGKWRILPRLWERDVAIPIAYAGRTPRRLSEREIVIFDGPSPDPDLVDGCEMRYRNGDITVFTRPSGR